MFFRSKKKVHPMANEVYAAVELRELDEQVKARVDWDALVAKGYFDEEQSPCELLGLESSAARPGMLMHVTDDGLYKHRTYLTVEQAADAFYSRVLKVG